MKGGVDLPKGKLGYISDNVNLNYNVETKKYDNVVTMIDASTGENFASLKDAVQKKVKKLLVTIEATHDGKTENFTTYNAQNMENSAYTWTSPFNKPVLKHHNTHGDAIGSVDKAVFGDSSTHPGAKTIFLTLSISDPDSVEKFLDGRYRTVSIGGQAKDLTCSVCGANILQDGFCGHWRGDKYSIKRDGDSKGEIVTCYWEIGDMEYEEVSVVNRPADKKQTGPVSIEAVTEGEDGGQSNSAEGDDTAVSDSVKIGKDADTSEIDDFTTTEDGKDAEPNVEDKKHDESHDSKEKDKAQSDSVDYKALYDEAIKAKESLETDIEAIQLEQADSKKELEALKDTNKELEEKLSFRTDQNIKLGVEFKKIMVDAIETLKDKNGITTDEKEYATMKLVDLKQEYQNIKNLSDGADKNPEEMKVTSPGIVDNENTKGVITDGESVPKKKESVSDIVSNII